MGCCASWCTANYHFQCARKAKCLFLENKEVYCEQHTSLAEGKVLLLMFLPFLLHPFLRDVCFTPPPPPLFPLPSSLPPLPTLLPSSSPHPPPSLLQAVLADADIAVLRCVIVEVHPDRTSRKIPHSLQPAKTSIQIGKISAVTLFISSCELSDLVHLIGVFVPGSLCVHFSLLSPSSLSSPSFSPPPSSLLPPPLLPPPLLPPPFSRLSWLMPILLLQCVIVEVHPDRTSRKIPHSPQPAKTSIQIGKLSAL